MSANYKNHIAISTLFECAQTKTELDMTSQNHLRESDFCRGRLSWMETASALGAKEPSYEPPKSVMDNVLSLGRPSRLKQLRNFVVASLTFDSFRDLASVPVRTCRSGHRWRSHQDRNFESMGRILISRSAADSLWSAGFFSGPRTAYSIY